MAENWKLREIAGKYEIISEDSAEYRSWILNKLDLPLVDNFSIHRSQTEIDWKKMAAYYRFFIDGENEEFVKKAFEESALAKYKNVILTYGWKEPVVKVSTELFLQDWEGFIRSQIWEGLIFSEDFTLVIESTRDYYLHSNFEILPKSIQLTI